jgi:LysR family hydrogen peroxide-inducible transcriptional activator
MPQPTLPQLQAFVAVATFSNFTEAAVSLHTSQPAVTQQIKALEKQVKADLFYRSQRGAQLTPEGERLLPRAHAILASLEDFRSTARGLHDGLSEIRISSIPTMAPYLIPTIVGTLREEFSHLQLHVGEARTHQLLERLQHHEIDMALMALPSDTRNLTEFVIGDDEFVLAVPSGHRLAGEADVPITSLQKEEVLVIEDGHCLRGQTLAICTMSGNENTRDVGAAGLSTVCQMVASRQGVTLLPRSAVTLECREGSGIIPIQLHMPRSSERPKRTIGLVWRSNTPHDQEFRAIAEILKPALQAQLDS